MREVDGDLLRIAERGEAIGHGCNCDGVMGGLAAHVESHWPALAADYRAACRAGTLTLGGVLPWLDEASGVWIYNLATQQHPGADARLDAIDSSVRAAIEHARANGVSTIYLPRIGAGIGGLRWEDLEATLSSVSADADDVDLVVVTPPRGR
jgi:O-acetyl-ADP-ribose deacetylase (regulator of RNase III)